MNRIIIIQAFQQYVQIVCIMKQCKKTTADSLPVGVKETTLHSILTGISEILTSDIKTPKETRSEVYFIILFHFMPFPSESYQVNILSFFGLSFSNTSLDILEHFLAFSLFCLMNCMKADENLMLKANLMLIVSPTHIEFHWMQMA